MSQTDTGSALTPKQARALEALMERGPEQTMEDVARAARVSRRSLYRYLGDPAFRKVFRERVELEMGAHRQRVAAALIRGAATPGPGQAAMQKLYWQRLGELIDARSLQFEDSTDEILSRFLGCPKDQLPD